MMAARFPEDSASSTSGSVSEDFLTCLICTEPYENPKVLPCHHTFCTGCLDRYFTTVQQEGTQEPGTLPCPVCRRVVTVPEAGIQGLNQDGNLVTHRPPAEPIQDLAQKIEKSTSKKVHCDVCKYRKLEILAKDHCASCGINYCEHCSRDHSKHCLFRNHSVVPVNQMEKSSLRCETHDAETVKYYCFTCMVPLCTVCAVTEHQKHETAELHDAMGNKKDAVMTGIGSMSEKVATLEEYLCELEDLQSLKDASMKKTKMEVDRHVNNLIGQLHMRKHAVMEEMDKLHNVAMKQISIEKESVAFQLANMKSLWKFGAKLCEPSQSLQLLAMYTDIMIMIESTRNKAEPKIPSECALMSMFMPRPDLSVGSFQKCELTPQRAAKAPGLTNGHSNQNGDNLPTASPRIPKSSSLSSLSRPMSAPPTFFKDPFKEQPSLKWLVSPKLCWKVDKVGGKVGEICESYDVAILPDGCTVVAEWMNQRLQIFDEKGQSVSILGAGSIQPWGLTVTREGNLAVSDDKERSIKIMDPTGRILTSWKKNLFGWPRGLCENTLGQYVVADTEHGKHTVSIHLPDGRCVRKFGSQGTGNNQFHWPRYVTVDHDDRIIVSDGSNHCIKVFDASGQFMYKFGGIGASNGQMKHPRGVCVDPQNNILVADQDNNRVTLFSPEGKFLRHLLAISKPWGVYVSDSGLLAVTQKPALKVFRIFDPVKC